jgi:hypothetical protein
MPDLISFFSAVMELARQNIHVAGWIFLIYNSIKITWRVSLFLDKIKESGETIQTLATNHLPHLQAAVDDLTKEVKGLRQDLITIVLHK